MIAGDNTTRRDGDDPIEVIVARLEQGLAELQERLGDFDPVSFKADVHSDFETFRENTQGTVQSLEVHLTAAVAKISSFEKLLKDAADLLKKMEALDLQKLDPEKIKQAVLDALADWRNTTDTRLGNVEARVADLEAKIKALSPEAIRDAVLESIKTWQTQVETDLKDLKSALDKVTNDLKALSNKLASLETELKKDLADLVSKTNNYDDLLSKHGADIADLLKRIKALEDGDIDKKKIAEEVERLIKDWKILVETRLDALERLKNDVQTLKDRLDGLPHIFSEGEIKTWIINEITPKITDLNATLTLKIKQLQDALLADLSSLNARVLTIEDKLKDLDPGKIVILVIKELEIWKTQVEQRLTMLEAQRVLDRGDIDKLLQDLAQLTAKVNALIILTRQDVLDIFNANIQPWITKVEAIQQSLLALDNSVKAHDLSISTLNTAISAIQSLLSGPLPANWETQIRDIIATLISDIKADIVQLKADKITLENALAALDVIVKALEADLVALTERVDLLLTKAQIEVFVAAEIAKLKTILEGLIQSLDVRMKAMEDADVLIQEEIEKIKAAIAEIIEKNTTQDEKLTALHVLIVAVKNKVDNLPPIPKAEDIVKEVETIIIKWKEDVQVQINDLIKCCNEGKQKMQVVENEIIDIKKHLKSSDASAIGIRLARRCLTGWGIIGGLEIKSDDTCSVHLSKGSGITPRGVLTHACDPLYFTHYRTYNTQNPAFKSYPLWELLVWEDLGIDPGEAVPDEIEPLTPQTGKESETPFIADKVVIMLPGEAQNHYLLIKIEDLIALQGKTAAVQKFMGDEDFDPDMQFSESFSPLDALPTDDDLYKAFNPVMLLPEIPLFRFGFRPPDECEPEELDDPNFPQICSLDHLYEVWQPIIKDAFTRVDKWFKVVMAQYHDLLFPQLDINILEEKNGLLFEKWADFLEHNKNAKPGESRKYYIQYFYDWARDLIASYHELRLELQILMAEYCLCKPNLLQEQRPYLMLGPALRPTQDGLAAPLRDAFHQPPIFNSNALRLESCRLYYRRHLEMIEGFYLPIYNDASGLPCWCKHDDDKLWESDFSHLRITPGKGYIHALSRQSIPFYYPLAPNMESLHFYWEYRRAKMRQTDYHLSYHASDADDSYSHRPEVLRPLYYSLDSYDFYRIEGATGRYSIAFNKKVTGTPFEVLELMIKRYNLDFEVVEVDLSSNQCRFLSQKYPLPNVTPQEFFNAFRQDLMGAEHLAGVPKGGTFIIVTERIPIEGMMFDSKTPLSVVADFALPYRCCPPKPCRFDIETTLSQGCKNGTRAIEIRVTPVNMKSGQFYAAIDGKNLTSPGTNTEREFSYQNGIRSESIRHELPAGKEYVITIKDKISDCCSGVSVFVPMCDCKIKLKAEIAPHSFLKKTKINLIVNAINTGSAFSIAIDGNLLTHPNKNYDADGITTVPLTLDNGKTYQIKVSDVDNPTCFDTITVVVPDKKPELSISAVPSNICLQNGETSVELHVKVLNTIEGAFDVKRDGVAVAAAQKVRYDVSGLNVVSINVPGDGAEHSIEVVDSQDKNLSARTIFRVVDCSKFNDVQFDANFANNLSSSQSSKKVSKSPATPKKKRP